MYQKIIYLIILQSTILSIANQQCTTCQDLTYLNCNICYDNCTRQQLKQFQKCSYTYCTNYISDSNDSRTCTDYKTVELEEKDCFGKCCDSKQEYFTIDQLNKCVDKNKQIMTTSIIVSVVVGVAFFFIFVLCCLCFRRRLGRGIGCCSNTCVGRCIDRLCCHCLRQNPTQNNPPYNSNRSHEQLIGQYLKWQQDPQINKQIQDKNSNCAVCLVNNVNAYTTCKHFYHIQCIMEWFNRKPICPLCKSTRIENIKLYCRSCCVQYVRVNLNVHRDIGRIFREINGPNCPNCQ